jgi:hypothetical protein
MMRSNRLRDRRCRFFRRCPQRRQVWALECASARSLGRSKPDSAANVALSKERPMLVLMNRRRWSGEHRTRAQPAYLIAANP